MRTQLVAFLYRWLPDGLIQHLGQSRLLQPLRNSLLRSQSLELTQTVPIQSEVNHVDFYFEAPVKVAVQAQHKGIEKHITDAILKLLAFPDFKQATVVDAGASNGFLSCYFAQTISSQGKVFAFEPHPEVFKRLQKNLTRNNLQQATCFQLALGDSVTSSHLNLYYETANRLTLAGKKAMQTISIDETTLDHFFASKQLHACHLIKIDVDGYETAILKGAEKTIAQFKPVVVYESNQQTLPGELLIKNGYRLFDLTMKKIDNTLPLPHDVLAVHPAGAFTI
ncbi:MAG: FkbM family methyltransferase [Bacteroidia bacterium]|nr:FkbM family methyltransferase [Bacteroidia bacterium]